MAFLGGAVEALDDKNNELAGTLRRGPRGKPLLTIGRDHLAKLSETHRLLGAHNTSLVMFEKSLAGVARVRNLEFWAFL